MSVSSYIYKLANGVWSYYVEFQANDATALAHGNGLTGLAYGLDRNTIAHAHTAATMAYSLGKDPTNILGLLKEAATYDPSKAKDTYKDLFNNEIGIKIGRYVNATLGLSGAAADEAIDDLVMDAYRRGDLIVDHDTDPRVLVSSPVWYGPSSNWQSASSGRDYTDTTSGEAILMQMASIPFGETASDWIKDASDWANGIIPALKDLLSSWLIPAVGMHGGRGMVNFGSPLILDLDGDGAHSTKLGWGADRSTVYFDMDNDGFAERTAWVSKTDGLLAFDRNSNGKIDGQSELFGNSATYADGFASLKTLDSNADNKITAADAQFANLRVWVDADRDGQTDAGELKTLAALGITQINLAATALTNTYDQENLVSAKSSFIIGGQSREIADHWFRFGQEDSRYMGDVTLDVRTLFLPTLKGFGNLKDLHVAMSQDATLLGLVQNFTAGFETKDFLNGAALDAEIQSILFRWAGVDGFSDSDTTFGYNAKINGFLDKITGQKSGWLEGMSAGQTVSSTVISTQTIVFNNLFNNLKTMLVSQTAAGAALLDGLRYDLASGDFQGAPVLSTQGLAKIASDTASLNTSDKNSYWNQLNTYLLHVKPVEDFTAAEVSGLNAIWPMIGGVTWENYAYFYYGSRGYIMTTGATNLSVMLAGDLGADTISGGNGDDYLYGGGSNDTLRGGEGNDHLFGEAGNDYLVGGAGSDIYTYGGGQDTISEEVSGADTLVFGEEYKTAVVTFSRPMDALSALDIKVDGVQAIRIENQFSSIDRRIETVLLGNGASVNLALAMDVVGTSGNDTLSGLDLPFLKDDHVIGGSGNDTLNGLLGNDVLEGETGDDRLDGGAGNDRLLGGDGNDTYVYAAGGGQGMDTILDYGGTSDTIVLGAGYTAANVTIERSGRYDMIVKASGQQILFIENQFSSPSSNIETLKYGDGTTINLGLVSFTVNGTESADTLYGVSYGAGGDIIYGLGGNDYIESGDGNDQIYGGTANDYILAGSGNDIVSGGAGNDTISSGGGNDTIIYDGGVDTFSDSMGTDIITITNPAITSANLTLQRSSANNYDLSILIGGSLAFTLQSQFASADSAFETIKFSDGTNFNLMTVQYTTNGTAGNDYVYGIGSGGNPDDILNGLAGNDYLYGLAGNDTIDGGTGNDVLYGGDGNDTYKINLGSGIDQIWDDSGIDKIVFGAGYAQANMTMGRDMVNANDLNILFGGVLAVVVKNHFYYGATGNLETLQFSDATSFSISNMTFAQSGSTGSDSLNGHEGRDSLAGLDGSDTLKGYAGDDTLTGGTGNDSLSGGAGKDTYKFSVGDGLDTIYEQSGATDTVLMGTGITASNIRFERSGADLNVYYGTSDKVTLSSQFYDDINATSSYDEVETLKFADGTSINLKGGLTFTGTAGVDSVQGTSLADTLLGLGGDDSLTANGGDDSLTGGTGNDYLSGDAGNDTYKFAIGDGVDEIYDQSGTADTLLMGMGITAANIRFEKSGNNLNIYYGTSDRITVQNQFYDDTNGTSSYDEVETLKFADGTSINLKGGLTFTGTAGVDNVLGTNLADTLLGLGGDDSLTANGGDDSLTGGTGNDYLSGDAGNDTYKFAIGDGVDEIYDQSGTADTLLMGMGITAANIRFEKSGNNLNIYYGTSDRITVQNQFYDDTNGTSSYDEVETLKFADGTSINLKGGLTFTGTAGVDNVLGTNLADTLLGLGGDDSLTANGGDDSLTGGTGNDYLSGDAGSDTYKFAIGDGVDTIYEQSGTADTLLMGTGITASNVRLEKYGNNLNIYYGTSDKITVQNQFYDDTNATNYYDEVETLKFADGTSINLKGGLTFTGTAGVDSVQGTSLADTLLGLSGDDSLTANGGNDTLTGGTGNDSLSGGAGSDTYKFAIGDGVDTVSEGTGTDTLLMGTGITAANIRFEMSGSNLNIYYGTSDRITVQNQFYDDSNGTNYYDEVETLKFADGTSINLKGGLTFTGTAAGDSVYGTNMADILSGLAGDDQLYSYAGNDTLSGGTGNDYIDGGLGVDTASYAGTSAGVTVSLLTTAAQNTVGAGTDTLTGIENLLGSSYNDTLIGDANANTIEGGLGNDTLNGGAGVDTVSYSKATAAVTVDLSLATSQNTVGAGSDLLSNFENIFGSAFADTLKGNASANVINGGAGNDVLLGKGGTDTLYGGLGADSFKFDVSAVGNIDTVKDFKLAEADKLDIRDLLVGYDPLTKAITAFVECTTSGANTIVKVDRDGAGSSYAWQQIAVLENAVGLTDEAALKASGTLIA